MSSITTFKKFTEELCENFSRLIKDADRIYEIDCDTTELWNLYLDSFPAGSNEIYRERREMDCVACRHFMRDAGNMAFIRDNRIETIWNFTPSDPVFRPVVAALNAYLLSRTVTDVFVTPVSLIGKRYDKQMLEDGTILTWDHMHLEVPTQFVNRTGRSEGDIKGEQRDSRNVFKRSLDEISDEAIAVVLELIASDSLYRGAEWKKQLEQFRDLHTEYHKLSDSEKENYAWVMSGKLGPAISRIRNHSIGTLLVNITEGMDLETAVGKWEQLMAPSNYKRPKAIFTAKMLENAKKELEKLGLLGSLGRRYATLDDITVNNILFSNKDAQKRIKGAGDVFDDMLADVKKTPMKFEHVEEVHVDRFIHEILPTAKSVEAYVENRHAGNFVSLIAPENSDAPTLFKWDNPFGWAYAGNITDSEIRENVKKAGGKTDGIIRFSIQWNDDTYNGNDFDAHCIFPGGHIYFGNKRDRKTGGELDVDIINPQRGIPAVENIVFPAQNMLKNGTYQFLVNCFSNNGSRTGFKAELEVNGNVFHYEHKENIRTGRSVGVADVNFDGNTFTVGHKLKANEYINTKEIWGIRTMDFTPVTTIMYSPNYWDRSDSEEASGIGNKHYFFMLKDCANPDQPNGFYNEFLKPELNAHKHVLEALGTKLAVANADDQLSGIGFSSTKRNSLFVRVTGATERVMKIKF